MVCRFDGRKGGGSEKWFAHSRLHIRGMVWNVCYGLMRWLDVFVWMNSRLTFWNGWTFGMVGEKEDERII